MKCVLRVFVCAVACWCVAAAHAQQFFLPQYPLRGYELAQPLVAGEFQLDPQDFLTEASAYLDGMEALTARTVEDERRFRERVKLYDRAHLSLRDTERLQEINAKAQTEHIALLAALVDRLKMHVPAEQAERLDQLKAYFEVRVVGAHYHPLFDIAELTPFRVPGTPQQRKACWTATVANAANRAHALRAVLEEIWANTRATAERAEKAGVVGLDWSAIRAEWVKIREEQDKLAGAPDENRAILAALETRLNAIREMREPDPTLTPAWWELSRVQLAALDEVRQVCGPAVFAPKLHLWYGALAGGKRFDIPVRTPRAGNYTDVSEFARDVLRLNMSAEQRAKVRELCRTFVDGVRKRQLEALEQCVTQKQFVEAAFDQGAWIDGQIVAIGRAVGTDWSEQKFPAGELAPRLSDEDAGDFGQVPDAPVATSAHMHRYSRWNIIPAPYADDLARALRTVLRVSETDAPIVESLVRDVRACVERGRVEPKWDSPDLDLYVRAESFAATIACDRELITGLEAALGDRIDRNALATVAASWRTAEPAAPGGLGLVGDVDIPRAILEVPVSDESRRALMAEFAPAAAQWTQMAADYLRSRIAIRSVQDRWSFHPETDDQVAEQRTVLDEYSRIRAQWAAAARDMGERLAEKLTPAEVELWRAQLRRLQWPTFYEGWDFLDEVEATAIGNDTDAAAIRAAVAPILDKRRQAMQRAGDAAVRAALAVASIEELRATDRFQWPHDSVTVAARNAAAIYLVLGGMRSELALESLRHALPPDRAKRIRIQELFPLAESPAVEVNK